MRKKNWEEFTTKALRRQVRRRPRMAMHGRGLRSPAAPHAGKKLGKSGRK